MQFFKAFVSTLLIASPMVLAAPRPEETAPEAIDALIAELVGLVDIDIDVEAGLSARELQARQGWTCNFLGGNKGCQVKCFLKGKGGGYCNSKNVCVCH
ncbi:uncharacterized protein DNG_04425 [Cephalotrichum gorgonifer]|uniref:Invertebrate defensins family profile domain-containing protein n=1 Tax=Cephalotrichum gorgonifer TaxID=2041049 RepID=A0AAE8MYV3_9PEZI|nr:uncharacterized protein DNG_04425 [Cephalotrichum gorgonifer]